MKDSFEELMQLCKKSVKYDPWVKDRGLKGYCEEIEIEAREAIEAFEKRDNDNLREELGDVLLDWCHACLLAEEAGYGNVKEIIDGVKRKLMRRKPFILENRTVTREEQRRLWRTAKEKEKDEKAAKSAPPR